VSEAHAASSTVVIITAWLHMKGADPSITVDGCAASVVLPDPAAAAAWTSWTARWDLLQQFVVGESPQALPCRAWDMAYLTCRSCMP